MGVLDLFRLDGKVALVSGAGRGIGAASALALAEAGADVAVLARTLPEIEAVAAQARSFGGRAVAIATDANDAEQVASAVEQVVTDLGRIDIVVAVVGGAMPKSFMATTDHDLRNAFDHNVLTGIRLVRGAIPHLLAVGGGSVVMVSSAMGHNVGRGYMAYGASKAALDHAVRLMAADLCPRIRVNAIAPGAILTEALQVVADNPEIRSSIENATPLRRLGEPIDVAAGVLYLASAASGFVTGQILAVDGGVHAPNFELPIPDLS